MNFDLEWFVRDEDYVTVVAVNQHAGDPPAE